MDCRTRFGWQLPNAYYPPGKHHSEERALPNPPRLILNLWLLGFQIQLVLGFPGSHPTRYCPIPRMMRQTPLLKGPAASGIVPTCPSQCIRVWQSGVLAWLSWVVLAGVSREVASKMSVGATVPSQLDGYVMHHHWRWTLVGPAGCWREASVPLHAAFSTDSWGNRIVQTWFCFSEKWNLHLYS